MFSIFLYSMFSRVRDSPVNGGCGEAACTVTPTQTTAAPTPTTVVPTQTAAVPTQTTAALKQTTAALKQTTAAPKTVEILDVWTEKPGVNAHHDERDYILLQERCAFFGRVCSCKEQGRFRLKVCRTNDPDPSDGWLLPKQLQGCGDPSVVGEYMRMVYFIVHADTPDFAVAKKLTFMMQGVMRARGVEYVEGDIFKGELPMFQACGFRPLRSRYLWVYQRVPAAQLNQTTSITSSTSTHAGSVAGNDGTCNDGTCTDGCCTDGTSTSTGSSAAGCHMSTEV